MAAKTSALRHSDTRHFAPSTFDERSAMPVLVSALPTLEDARTVDAVSGRLRRPWARPGAFDALHEAYILEVGAGGRDHGLAPRRLPRHCCGRSACPRPAGTGRGHASRQGATDDRVSPRTVQGQPGRGPSRAAAGKRPRRIAPRDERAAQVRRANEAALPILSAVEAGHPDPQVRRAGRSSDQEGEQGHRAIGADRARFSLSDPAVSLGCRGGGGVSEANPSSASQSLASSHTQPLATR